MKFAKILLIILLTQLTVSCSTSYEVSQLYKNWGYSGERLLPIKTNDSKFSLRIWINNSTSVDRIISISKDSLEDYKGSLVEVGNLYNSSNKEGFFKESSITPNSGFLKFIDKIDSLNIFELPNRPGIEIVEHQPISLYVIEIKRDSLYNIFKFETHYPNQTIEKNKLQEDKYLEIEKLIFKEFNLFEKFRFEQNGS